MIDVVVGFLWHEEKRQCCSLHSDLIVAKQVRAVLLTLDTCHVKRVGLVTMSGWWLWQKWCLRAGGRMWRTSPPLSHGGFENLFPWLRPPSWITPLELSKWQDSFISGNSDQSPRRDHFDRACVTPNSRSKFVLLAIKSNPLEFTMMPSLVLRSMLSSGELNLCWIQKNQPNLPSPSLSE